MDKRGVRFFLYEECGAWETEVLFPPNQWLAPQESYAFARRWERAVELQRRSKLRPRAALRIAAREALLDPGASTKTCGVREFV